MSILMNLDDVRLRHVVPSSQSSFERVPQPVRRPLL
jgi:hypothetical protein